MQKKAPNSGCILTRNSVLNLPRKNLHERDGPETSTIFLFISETWERAGSQGLRIWTPEARNIKQGRKTLHKGYSKNFELLAFLAALPHFIVLETKFAAVKVSFYVTSQTYLLSYLSQNLCRHIRTFFVVAAYSLWLQKDSRTKHDETN